MRVHGRSGATRSSSSSLRSSGAASTAQITKLYSGKGSGAPA